jgi:YYY domain-containing protein
MVDFLIWYLLISILGWISFPIAFRFFKALPGKGFAFSKVLGLLLWGFIFWFFTSIGLLKNNLFGQVTALVLVIGLSFWSGWKDRFKALIVWVKDNRKLILIIEIFFFFAFALWAFVRSTNPEIIGTEKPMEMAFINAILKSPTFPPNDPWLSGYGISYYYFGYVIIAMLIRISGVSSGIAYNLSAALWFALTAICAYGLLFDLVKARWLEKLGRKVNEATPNWVYFSPLLAPFLILIVSNLHGFLDILHSRGVFWTTGEGGEKTSAFWQWIQLNELDQAPIEPFSWFPRRIGGVQWWGASRVLQDFKLNLVNVEVIDEFPLFSYLLADLHPHVLAMPFVIMITGEALNVFMGGFEGEFTLFKKKLPFSLPTLILMIVSIGGLIFMNTWDSPFYLSLIAAAFMMRNYLVQGWSTKRIWEMLGMMVSIGILAVIFYLPFFLGFASQAGGIYPSLIFYTHGVYFWIMFGPLLIPVIGLLVYEWGKRNDKKPLLHGFSIISILLVGLFVLTWAISFLASKLPSLGAQFLWLQGATEVGIFPLLWEALRRRLVDPLTWVTLVLTLSLGLGLLLKHKKDVNSTGISEKSEPTLIFVLLLIILGALLTLTPEFVYLRDQFSVRMNTIFKFYFQAWILWGLAGSYAIIILWRRSGRWSVLTRMMMVLVAVLLLASAVITVSPNLSDELSIKSIQNNKPGALLQDWLLLASGAILLGSAIVFLIKQKWLFAFRILVIIFLIMGLVYPVIALWNKTGGFQPSFGYTLDGTAYYKRVNPDMMSAVDWLTNAPLGVMVEAVSPGGGSYSGYARVSTFSGMPTVLGWVGHVSQWRGGGEEMGSRQNDITMLYTTESWEESVAIIEKYNIRYIYVGDLERSTYNLDEGKFSDNLPIVFENNSTVIYEMVENSGVE